MTLRVANAMLMNFESVHVVEELGEWLKNWPGVRFGYNVLPQNMERFAFILERKNEYSCTMGGVVIPFEAISACKSMYAAIHTMMELKNKRRDGSEKMRFGSLPETLSIRIERHQLDGDGEVALDVTPLNCAWVMDFGEIGFNDLVSDGVKPRRYEMIGAIIGMRVQAAPGDTAAMGNPANTIQTMAVMRSPEGVWYKVDHASKMDDYMCRGKPIEAEELYAMVGCEQGKLAPASRRDTPYFVMHLYYRDHKMLMPIPKSDEHPSRFLPCAFHDLFDSSHSERVEGTAQIAQFIRTLVQADGGDRDKVSLRDVIKYAPSLTHLSDIDYGTRNPMPKNMFALMDKDGTLIGRTAYQLFRARMLTQLCSVFGIVAEESGTDARQEQVEAILQAAQDEWNEPLNPLDKLSWIAVADYFNRSHYSMATPSATSPKTPPMLLKRHTDNYNTAPGTRMTARSLFAEQWPVLVDKKIEFNSLSAEEQKDPGKRMRFMNETPLKPHAVADEGVRECKRAIKLVKEDTLLMDMIWEEMEPKSREVFSGLAKARNEMKLLTRQGMCETWETMPFTMNDDGEGFDPSVFRLEVVCGAMPSFDPRAVKLRELEAKTDAGTPYFVNGHVMLAMREEIANPSVNYAAPNFGLVYDDKIWFSEACSEKVRNVLGAKESVPTTCISVDPISGMSISDTLTIARAHAMYSKDNVFLTKQRAQVLKPPDTLAVQISPHPVEVRDPEAIPEEGMDVSIGKMQCLNMLHRRDVGPVMVGIDLTMTGECFTSATDFKGRNYELVGLLYQKHTARKHELGMTTDILHAGTHRGAMGPAKVPPQVWKSLTDTGQPLTLITDDQRRKVFALFERWNSVSSVDFLDSAANELHGDTCVRPATPEQLDGMMRAAMGFLRMFTGHTINSRGESAGSAVQRDCENTLLAMGRLNDLQVTKKQFTEVLSIVLVRANKSNTHMQNLMDDAIRGLEKAEARETKDGLLHKAVLNNFFKPSEEDHIRILIKHMGRGEVWKGVYPDAKEPSKNDPVSKVRTVMSGVVQEPAWTTFWVRHNHPEHGWKWDRQGYDCKIIRRCDDEESHDPPEQLLLGSDEDGNEYSVVAYYRYSDHVINEVNCQCRLWDMMQNPCSVEEKEVSLSLMASSSFLREMIYHVSSRSMRATTADKILKVFMITLCDPSHSRKSFEAAIRLTGDTSLQHDEFVSFMASRTFAKKKLSGYYQQEEKARKRRPVAGCDGTHAPVIELTEEEREQLAIEHAKELKRKWVAEAEARARSAAIQAERVERERLAAEEAAAAAEALREQQKVAEAERAARAAEEARVLREAREEKAVREKAVAEARAAVENQKAKDEAAAKAAKVAMAKEARKAKREANKERKHAPLDVKTQVTRDAAQRKQKQTSEQKAAELAAKMAAEKEAKEAAEKERARIEAARADAAAAAKAAAVKQHKAHKKAERVSALEAEGIADEAELAEAWLSSHSSQPSRSSDPVPPLSPVSTSTATSSRVLCEYENECIVCFSAPQTHLCTHCFNLALCGACADTMTTCPVCREETEFRMVHRP